MAEVVIGKGVPGELVCATGQNDGFVGLDALLVQKCLQELTAKFHACRFLACGVPAGRSHHQCIAHQLHFRAIAVGVGAVGRGCGEMPFGVDAANTHLVNLQNVGVREMPRLNTINLAFELAALIESLDAELAHEIVRLVTDLLGDLRHAEDRRVAHQPVSSQRQRAHHQYRHVDGHAVPQAGDHAPSTLQMLLHAVLANGDKGRGACHWLAACSKLA